MCRCERGQGGAGRNRTHRWGRDTTTKTARAMEGQQQGAELGLVRPPGAAHLGESLPVHMIHHYDLIVEGSCGASRAEGGDNWLKTRDPKQPREGWLSQD